MLITLMLTLLQPAGPSENLQGLIDAERAFAAKAEKDGISPAFLHYLSDGGLIFRPLPMLGKKVHQEQPAPGEARLRWEPRFVTIAADGNLGMSTGPYTYQARAEAPVGHGHFISVWKKESAGWRVLLDLGTPHPAPQGAYPALSWIQPKAVGKRLSEADLLSRSKELSELEGRFVRSAPTERAAYTSVAHPQLRWMRPGQLPIVGREAAQKAWSEEKPAKWEPKEVVVARSGDFGYSYGTLKQVDRQSAYVHVYVRDEGWRLLLDIALPAEGK